MGARSFGRRVGGASSTVMGVPLRWETPVAGEAARVAGVGGAGGPQETFVPSSPLCREPRTAPKVKKKKKVLGKKNLP